MPSNPLDLLPGEGQAIGFVRSAIAKGISIGELRSKLAEQSINIREEALSRVYEYFSGPVNVATKYVQSVNLNARLNVSRLPVSATPLLRNFAYEVKISGIDVNTQEATSTFITVSTNKALSKQEAVDQATAMVEGNSEKYGIEGATGQVTTIFQNVEGIVTP